MPESGSPSRMLRTLPSLFRRTSFPTVDYKFFSPHASCIFRPYRVDEPNGRFTTEEGKEIALARTADEIVDAIYGKALQVAASAGEVVDLGVDVDTDLGTSFTLTFIIHPLWDRQPAAASAFYPFRHATSPNPRVGYDEQNGVVEAKGWIGRTSGNPVDLTYSLGWKPRQLLAVTLVSDAAADTMKLYVNGVERASANEAVKANVAGKLRMHRASAESGITGVTNVEAYFLHAKAVAEADIKRLHRWFTTGETAESRWVRMFMALGMAFGEIEDIGFRLHEYRSIEDSTKGALTTLAKDFNVNRKAGESDTDLRQRLRERLAQVFGEGVASDIIEIASNATGLQPSEIILLLNEDESGNDKHAYIAVLLPPGNEDKLTDLDTALKEAKAAGIQHATGTSGTFAWDTADAGFGLGAWRYTR